MLANALGTESFVLNLGTDRYRFKDDFPLWPGGAFVTARNEGTTARTFTFQDSSDGTTWANVTGATAVSVVAKGIANQEVTSRARYVRVLIDDDSDEGVWFEVTQPQRDPIKAARV